jgi:outer membrane protein TolC
VELKADYNFAEGEFLNTERSVPADGQVGLGLSVNLLEGLITDRRRTDLRIAQAFGEQAIAEREALLVNLFLDAAEAYWDWSLAQANAELADRFRQLAEQQLDIVVAQFRGGNRAAIDTLEARIRVDKRYAEWIEASIRLANARWMVSAFLWTEDGFPIALDEALQPELPQSRLPEVPGLNTLVRVEEELPFNHPVLRAGFAKWSQLEAERRFKTQAILPSLQGSYAWLTPASPFGENLQDRLTADYKWGIELEVPLFFRKDIGAARAARWKLEQLQWEQAQKTIALQVKLRQAYNKLEGGQQLLERYQRIAEDSRILYQAEQTRFAIGESTPFLVNSRENSYLDAQLKYLSTQAKQHVLEAQWFWASGRTGP